MGQFPGSPYREAAGTAGAQVWRQRFPGEPHDSLENFRVLQRVTRCVAVIQSTYSSPNRAIAGGRSQRPGGQQSRHKVFGAMWPTGVRSTPRSAPASTFGSMPMRSAVAAMLTAGASSPAPQRQRSTARDASRCRWQARPPRPSPPNQCPAERAAAATLTRPLLSAAVRMCRTFQNSVVNRVVQPCVTACPSRCRWSRGAGVFEDDTGVAETP